MTTPPTGSALKNLVPLFTEVYNIWVGERPAQAAAALAYYGMFSFAPVIFVVFTLAGFFIDQLAAFDRLYMYVEMVLGADAVALLRDLVDALAVPGKADSVLVSLISFLALFYAASGLFFQLQYALNVVWRVPPPARGQTRAFLTKRLFSFVMVVGFSLLLIAAAVINLVLNWFGAAAAFFIGTSELPILLAWLTMLGLITLSFGLMYKLLPDVPIAFTDVWPGALTAALLVMAAASAAAWFVGSGQIGSALAAAGAVAVFLMAINVIAQIFLLGAVITRVYSGMFGSRRAVG